MKKSIKVSSRKAKARILQKLVVEKILEKYPDLTANDVKSTPMGVQGSDVQLSEKARSLFPYGVEAKAHATFAIYKHYQQACDNAMELIPLLVIKGNNMAPLVVMSLEDWFAHK